MGKDLVGEIPRKHAMSNESEKECILFSSLRIAVIENEALDM